MLHTLNLGSGDALPAEDGQLADDGLGGIATAEPEGGDEAGEEAELGIMHPDPSSEGTDAEGLEK